MDVPDSLEETIFAAARALSDPKKQTVYLDLACGNNQDLRRRIERLLKAGQRAHAFFAQYAELSTNAIPTLADTGASRECGSSIGRYKLLEKVGEGGFAVVWMAEQHEPVRRRVALKILKPGLETKNVIARFEAERQALAMMDHPNIAKVFDAGATEKGQPFFVMELVRGIRITDFCDTNQLPTSERLKLFLQVCHAVQHAHQKGIIHRDIKPSNILVTLQDGVPVPKVIDFGIAKATQQPLTDKTLFTQFQQVLGTPAYMSPEQTELSALDIDTRSDIYSLGVLLYELLTGGTPFDPKRLLEAGFEEMRRIIRETEPPRPSTRVGTLTQEALVTMAKRRQAEAPKLIHLLRGDLDWIVMRALEKDRRRRYETADGLAADIERHLHNEPVIARPPSPAYRLQKLVRRNKLLVVASSAIASALILGASFSTWSFLREHDALGREAEQRHRAEQQTQIANANQRKAEQSDRLTRKHLYAADMLQAYDAFEHGNLVLARQLLGRYRPANGAGGPSADLRGWEWQQLWQRTAHNDDLFELRGHQRDAQGAGLLPDGHTVVSTGVDGALKLWDLNNPAAAPESVPGGPGGLAGFQSPLRLSADGAMLAVAGDDGWAVWDTEGRRFTANGGPGATGLALSSDKRKLALSREDHVEIVDLVTKERIHQIARTDSDFMTGVAFSPDGNFLAYASGDSRIGLYDLASRAATSLGQTIYLGALSLTFSPDGQLLVSADRGGISVWNVSGRTRLKTLTAHQSQVTCVAFSPDGKLLASASGDHSIKLWDTSSWEELATLYGHEGEVHSVAFSADGRRLVSSGPDRTVRIWSAHPQARVPEHRSAPPPNTGLPLWHARGSRSVLVHGDWESISFVDRTTFQESGRERAPAEFDPTAVIAFGRNADWLAAGLTNGLVELWTTKPFRKSSELGPAQLPATALAFSDRGDRLAVLRSDDSLDIWNLATRQLTDRLPPLRGSYPVIAFSARDRCLVRTALLGAAAVEIWLLPEKIKREVHPNHPQLLTSAIVSNDGTLLATAAQDGEVKLWDIVNGELKDVLAGQLVGFWSLAFSSDDSRLAAAGFDGNVTLWDLTTPSHRQVAHWKANRYWCEWLEFEENDSALITSGDPLLLNGRWQTIVRRWAAPSLAAIDAQQPQSMPLKTKNPTAVPPLSRR